MTFCPRCGQPLKEELDRCLSCGLSLRGGGACASCGRPVRGDDIYCFGCGKLQGRRFHCWNCGSPVGVESGHCTSCGAVQPDLDRLSRTANGAEEEAPVQATDDEDRLKIVTVLFADVSGFTQMSEKLDPEKIKDVIDECFTGLTEVIHSRGGTVDKYIGDCVMALFGVPVARDNDAERAVDAALAMQEYLHKFSQDSRRPGMPALSMRIGINTGTVLAGYVGRKESGDFTVMGDAVNLASRLESACPVGSILVSQDTYRMVRNLYRVRQLAPLRVKGKTKPVSAFEVLGALPDGISLMDTAFREVPSRIIGREREMNQLLSAYNRVRDLRRPVLVDIRGPVGMGKSRMLFEFAEKLLSEGGCDLDFMRCRDYRTETTLAPLLDPLRNLIGTKVNEEQTGVRDKIRLYLDGLEIELEKRDRIEAALRHLLGDPAFRTPAGPQASDEPERLEAAVREGLLAFFQVRTRKRLLVVMVDDLQSASEPFLDLLTALSWMEALPVLLVLTYRPEAGTRVERRLGSIESRIHLSLDPLTDVDAEGMVRDLLQRVEDLPPEFVRRVVQLSRGQPLFIREILSGLLDGDVIRRTEDQWEVDHSRMLEIELPQSVEAAILARVDALTETSREAVQIASVVGEIAWEGLIAELGVSGAEQVLRQIEEKQFIRFRPRSRIAGEREFSFVLPVVRQSVEKHVLQKVKARLHGRIARWLENRIEKGDEQFDRLLAHHHAEAGNDREALPYRLRAGQHAEERGDVVQALDDLQWVWRNAGIAEAKLRVDPVQLAASRVSVARLLRRAGRPEEAQAAHAETRQVLEPLAGGRPAVDLSLRRAGLETARSLIQAGERNTALTLLQKSLEGADPAQPGMRQLAVQAKKWQGWIACQEEKYDQALRIFNEQISQIESTGSSAELAALLNDMGACLLRMGNFDEAERALNRCLECTRDVGNREMQAVILANLGVLGYRQHWYDDALSHLREAQRINEEIGNPVVAAVCRSNVGDVLLEQGNLDEARKELEGALSVFRRSRSQDYRRAALESLARCLRELGDVQAAQQSETELRAISTQG